MTLCILELSNKLQTISSSDQFWDACHAALEEYGVKSIAYGVVPFQSELDERGITAAAFSKITHPQEWIDEIGSQTLFDDDLTAEFMIEQPDTIIWQDESHWEHASRSQIEQAHIETELGLGVGATFSLAHNDKSVAAVGIGLNMPEISKAEFATYWGEKEQEIRAICCMLDNGMRKKHGSILPNLTGREQDVLTLFSIGLQREAVAYRLQISPKTVDHHIKSAKQKLKATSRTHAVAKALVIGAIQP